MNILNSFGHKPRNLAAMKMPKESNEDLSNRCYRRRRKKGSLFALGSVFNSQQDYNFLNIF